MAVLITIEGVLQSETGGAPINGGRKLFEAFKSIDNVILVTNQRLELVSHWLAVNGFKGFGQLVVPQIDDPIDAGERRVLQVRRITAYGGGPVNMVIETSPLICRALILAGIPFLLYGDPVYLTPAFRPDYEGNSNSWERFSAEAERSALLRHNDERLKAQET